jgi:hypothetical protein
MSGNQGISSATAKMTAAVSITVTVAVATTKPTVLFKYIIIVLVSDRLFPNRILNSKLMVWPYIGITMSKEVTRRIQITNTLKVLDL